MENYFCTDRVFFSPNREGHPRAEHSGLSASQSIIVFVRQWGLAHVGTIRKIFAAVGRNRQSQQFVRKRAFQWNTAGCLESAQLNPLFSAIVGLPSQEVQVVVAVTVFFWCYNAPKTEAVSTRVECKMGSGWFPGSVNRVWWREPGWKDRPTAPYSVRLDDGRFVFAPCDSDVVVRKAKSSAA